MSLPQQVNQPNFTAPNFGKKQPMSSGIGNMSQQNSNPFGVTNRGYKGTMIKGSHSKPPIMGGGGTRATI